MTPDGQRFIHPFRGDVATLPDADLGARFVIAQWTALPVLGGLPFAAPWRRGVEHAAAPMADRMRRAIAVLDDPGTPASEPEVEVVLMAILDQATRRGIVIEQAQGGANDRYFPIDAWLVRRWLVAGGAAFALRVLAAFPEVDIARHGTSPQELALSIRPRDAASWYCLDVGHLGVFAVLRRALARRDDAAGLAEARRIREAAALPLRCAIAFTFPDEPFWEADLAAAAPPAKKKAARLPPCAWGLATARVDEAALPAILDSMARDGQPFVTDTALYGYTLVHRLGDGAARHLLAYLAVARDAWAKERMAGALALTETEDTRAYFAGKVKDRVLGPIARAYLAQR